MAHCYFRCILMWGSYKICIMYLSMCTYVHWRKTFRYSLTSPVLALLSQSDYDHEIQIIYYLCAYVCEVEVKQFLIGSNMYLPLFTCSCATVCTPSVWSHVMSLSRRANTALSQSGCPPHNLTVPCCCLMLLSLYVCRCGENWHHFHWWGCQQALWTPPTHTGQLGCDHLCCSH